ncbi:MAG: hypothetical protein CSA55_04600 [Ilumatobacter coccineus]|uniref:PD-(D/E)XK endonuclease-like domain-containing protein n=1 Tax=Ilumatobacter coccineus TaxID=467094 RepID=A0A2G6K8B0_9ACTN|nr:MAG: hypothetical protein CSA55_04600 [Ilumatobacter coccineus]
MSELSQLTPLQQRTLDALRRQGDPLIFDPAFIASLRDHVDDELAHFASRCGDDQIFLSKHRITSVLGCEVKHLADDAFAWTPAIATGQISHRAIQLLLHWPGEPTAADLVDEAIERVGDEDTSLGEWIASIEDADRADLHSAAVDRVIKFLESFPPLDRRSHPTTESSIRWPNRGPIILSGKVDLTLGRAVGAESRKVLIDLKTGWVQPFHRDDLRFYALIETLRTEVPPRKLASFYLDSGEPQVEDVTENVLRVAARRTLDAVNAEIELRIEGRPPVARPGRTCRWCSVRPDCPDGEAYLAELDD